MISYIIVVWVNVMKCPTDYIIWYSPMFVITTKARCNAQVLVKLQKIKCEARFNILSYYELSLEGRENVKFREREHVMKLLNVLISTALHQREQAQLWSDNTRNNFCVCVCVFYFFLMLASVIAGNS